MVRRLLDPLTASLTIFGMQTLLWWLFMPRDSTLPGGAPRFESTTSYVRYGAFLVVWVIAIMLGKVIARDSLRHQPSGAADRPLDLIYLRRVATIALILTLLGELVYARDLLSNPRALLDAVGSGLFMSVGEETRNQRVVGISSLNNLFVIPAAVYALATFDPRASVSDRAWGRRRLRYLGGAVLVHALLFVGRQLFATFILIVVAAYLLLRGREQAKALGRAVLGAGLLMITVIWLGETFRGGLFYANQRDLPLLSAQTQQYVLRRLVEGYFASDVNNSFRLLSCPSPRDLVGTTMWRTPATALGASFSDFTECSLWTSITYNTSNVFGLWWWDADWFGLLIALAIGGWLGGTYILASHTGRRSGFTVVLYLLSFPGIVSLMRINYFGTTVFTVPTLFLILARMLQPRETASLPWGAVPDGEAADRRRAMPMIPPLTAPRWRGLQPSAQAAGDGVDAPPARAIPMATPSWRASHTGPAQGRSTDVYAACPYLGLAGDRQTRCLYATAAHRCYGHRPARPPAAPFQLSHCLTVDHRQCAVYRQRTNISDSDQ